MGEHKTATVTETSKCPSNPLGTGHRMECRDCGYVPKSERIANTADDHPRMKDINDPDDRALYRAGFNDGKKARDEEVAALRKGLNEYRETNEAIRIREVRLEAENKRLREALEALLEAIDDYRCNVLEHRHMMHEKLDSAIEAAVNLKKTAAHDGKEQDDGSL